MSPDSIGGNVPRDYERSARPDSPLRRRIRVRRACGRTSPHATRAEPRDTRAAAPPPAHATLANGGDRAPRRDAGAVAAGSVRRYLDAHDGVPARVARATSPAVRDRQGDPDAADAAPRHAARLCAHPGGHERDELSGSLGDETGEAARPVGARARSRGIRHVGGGARPPGERVRPRRRRCAPRLADGARRSALRPPPRDGALAAAQRATVCRDRGAGGARPGRGARRDLPPLPRGLRPLDAPRPRGLEQDARGRDRRRAGAARAAAPLPRRAGPRAPRRRARIPAGRRHSRARPLFAEVGQRPACLGRPHARAAGGSTGRR